ncbi:E3 ISG15--protein ligase HERC5-like [Diadema antillarum]|uniref:E3 ISG15--protein ligase HERC5-like n=2 Tax=Diadema antillarum TaxID=105358 RepID=UPI003A84F2CF
MLRNVQSVSCGFQHTTFIAKNKNLLVFGKGIPRNISEAERELEPAYNWSKTISNIWCTAFFTIACEEGSGDLYVINHRLRSLIGKQDNELVLSVFDPSPSMEVDKEGESPISSGTFSVASCSWQKRHDVGVTDAIRSFRSSVLTTLPISGGCNDGTRGATSDWAEIEERGILLSAFSMEHHDTALRENEALTPRCVSPPPTHTASACSTPVTMPTTASYGVATMPSPTSDASPAYGTSKDSLLAHQTPQVPDAGLAEPNVKANLGNGCINGQEDAGEVSAGDGDGIGQDDDCGSAEAAAVSRGARPKHRRTPAKWSGNICTSRNLVFLCADDECQQASSRNDQSRCIATVTAELLKSASSAENSPSKASSIQELRAVFSSPACLNASFAVSDDGADPDSLSVDLKLARTVFKNMENNEKMFSMVNEIISNDLLKSMPVRPCVNDAFGFLLSLMECPIFYCLLESWIYNTLLVVMRILTTWMDNDENFKRSLARSWKREPRGFGRMVTLFRDSLQSFRQFDGDLQLITYFLWALSSLNEMNVCHDIVPVSKFYLPGLYTTYEECEALMCDVYFGVQNPATETIWLKEYPFLLNLKTKIRILTAHDTLRQKEFFTLVFAELLDPERYGLVRLLDENDPAVSHVWFRQDCDDLELIRILGILVGLSLYNKAVVPLPFPQLFYTKLLSGGPENEMDQLLELDSDMAMRLTKLRDGTKEYIEENTVYMEIETEDGQNIPASEDINRYVQQEVRRALATEQMCAFRKGFYLVCRQSILRIFRPVELEDFVLGQQRFDWKALEQSTRYCIPYHPSHQTITMFWECFHSLEEEQKRKFLIFVSGADRVPCGGLADLGLTIVHPGPFDVNSPLSHTLPQALGCDNHHFQRKLKLPMYQDMETIKDRLEVALSMCQSPFHIA